MKLNYDFLLKRYSVWHGPVSNGSCCQAIMVHGGIHMRFGLDKGMWADLFKHVQVDPDMEATMIDTTIVALEVLLSKFMTWSRHDITQADSLVNVHRELVSGWHCAFWITLMCNNYNLPELENNRTLTSIFKKLSWLDYRLLPYHTSSFNFFHFTISIKNLSIAPPNNLNRSCTKILNENPLFFISKPIVLN